MYFIAFLAFLCIIIIVVVFLKLYTKPIIIYSDIINFKPPLKGRFYRYSPYDREKLLNDFIRDYQLKKYRMFLFTYGLDNDMITLLNLKEYVAGTIPIRLYASNVKDFSDVLKNPEDFSGNINSLSFIVYSICAFTTNYVSIADKNKISEIRNFREKLKGKKLIYEKKQRNTKFLPIFGKLLM